MIGNDLGTAIKEAIDALTSEEKQDLELVWQTVASEIASYHNVDISAINPTVGTSVDLTLGSGYFLVGGGVPSGQHLAMDGSRIQSKGSGTTASSLYLNPYGGNINIGFGAANFNVYDLATFYNDVYIDSSDLYVSGAVYATKHVGRGGISAIRLSGTVTGFTGAVQNIDVWNASLKFDSNYFAFVGVSPYTLIEILVTGWYKISYNIILRNDHTSILSARVRLATSADVFSNVSISYSNMQVTSGKYGACVATFLANLTAGVQYKLVVDGAWASAGFGVGGGSFAILDEASWVLEKI